MNLTDKSKIYMTVSPRVISGVVAIKKGQKMPFLRAVIEEMQDEHPERFGDWLYKIVADTKTYFPQSDYSGNGGNLTRNDVHKIKRALCETAVELAKSGEHQDLAEELPEIEPVDTLQPPPEWFPPMELQQMPFEF